ncbi:MAG TPA: quinone-dependent dihydroorotate dehydrogenase [Alphaproteobacteria bacterium]|nr:quinone-dependent dihydroorotate dehydrogenase [Alphaproteobacteria bacterium]
MMRVFRLLAPETAHDLALSALSLLGSATPSPDPPRLRISFLEQELANPIGLAAGLDKDAVAIAGLARLGFGAIEVGSVTPRPQAGNPRPRLFRLVEDQALVNRMGFNSAGHDAVLRRLTRYRTRMGSKGPMIGVNLGANRDSADRAGDYAEGIRRFSTLADYLVVNISSPNTPGLRGLQAAAPLRALLDRLAEARAAASRRLPLILKLAPDLAVEDCAAIVEIALAFAVDGLAIGNTTLARPSDLRSRHRSESGGLSGRPLFDRSTALLAEFGRVARGRLTLVGVGGVANGRDAYAKIRAGASLVQLYTALIYEGPGLIGRIKSELDRLLAEDRLTCVADAVGVGLAIPSTPRLAAY